jgi:hypothetical protein
MKARCEMAFVFHRQLGIPLWAMAFFAVALTAPPPARRSLITVLGIAVIAFTIRGLVPWLRASRSIVQVHSDGERQTRRTPTTVVAAASVRALDEANRITPEDALDLVRMDDDGGWQMARPRA